MTATLQPLKKLLLILDESTSLEELILAFQSALAFITKMETDMNAKVEGIEAKITEERENIIKTFTDELLKKDSTLAELKQDISDTLLSELEKTAARLLENQEKIVTELAENIVEERRHANKLNDDNVKAQRKELALVFEAIRKIPKPELVDEEAIISKTLRRIPAPVFPEIPKQIIETPEQVRDKLELLPEGEKLSIQAIQDLPKLLEELKKLRSTSSISGGLISKRIRFVDDETPSGTVDSANTIFTLSRAPETGSLKVYAGGSRLRINQDYTFDGAKTITFTLAPQVGEILLCDFRY